MKKLRKLIKRLFCRHSVKVIDRYSHCTKDCGYWTWDGSVGSLR